MNNAMQALDKPLRTHLERTIKAARQTAETAARAALEQAAVGDAAPPAWLDEPARDLRRRLRAHGRQLGDSLNGGKLQTTTHLAQEVAYQHWHRMLFARFLADNNLLMYDGVAVTLDECDELAPDEGAASGWTLAGKLAARMLPQVFKPGSPVFELTFAPEHQSELERLLKDLPDAVFQASDSLGWVYQFWQADSKERINKSGVKIGADELPAVTQLFTEPYMVDFLLHNSLGAWWATRHPGQPCPVNLDYFRTLDDGTPAAGNLDGWPDSLADFKLLDPCCGSGHFLVAAFLMLVPMRMAAEGLSARDAVDAVLADNLHGLELDPRCVEIAVFALAMAAWRYPDENGHPLGVRADMPAPQIACCGLKVAAKPEDWMALVPSDAPNAEYLRQELRLLHASFAQAPLLGSLLNPARSLKNDLATSSFDTLRTLLERALATERPATLWGQASDLHDDQWDLALTAQGLLDAARLLDARYHLVITNVPYLARGKQNETLRQFCATHYADAKNDLANVFLERCLELGHPEGAGVVQIVMPQNWLFLTSYKKQRKSLLKRVQWNLLARLGPGAFETISGEVVQAVLLTQTRAPAPPGFALHGVDASAPKTAQDKAVLLRDGEVVAVSQKGQLRNPDARVLVSSIGGLELLGKVANGWQGIASSDFPRFGQKFWEQLWPTPGWVLHQSTVKATKLYSGKQHILFWEDGYGQMTEVCQEGATFRGKSAWTKAGVACAQMGELPVTLYEGTKFDNNTSVLTPFDSANLPALWCFCSSPEFGGAVRRIDQKLNVTNATLVKVPFDLAHWQQVAAERYPNGLPKPYSDDPTQWLFHGHAQPATDPLQVAVARLVGYRWPAESDADMELAEEARQWIARCQALNKYADDDGIVCLPSVRGEPPAHERLLKMLIAAWETVQPGSWKPAVLDHLLAQADCAGKGLDVWLRDKFFAQHCVLFHHRPFIWHVWDGLKDGFAALVNYHRLDAKNLERLIHTYLGDWIIRQKRDAETGVDGAQEKLAAAEVLKKRLELILTGETPHDIFVRWKPIEAQPIGWHPDLNDGVRLNIRPFLTVPDIGKRGAGVLRDKPNIKWGKDRGRDVPTAPWYDLGPQYGGKQGDRINDHHLSLAEKRAARGNAK